MAYTRDIPTASQFQSVSQPIIKDNFNSCDDTFNLDHYGFSNVTSNIGLHRQVTTPDRGSHPASPITIPVLYSKSESTTNLGILQYSKGPNRVSEGNQVSTPITFIQSQEAAISMNSLATINVFDFTGITRAFATLYMGNFTLSGSSAAMFANRADIVFVNSSPFFRINNYSTTNNLVATASTRTLQIQNLTGGTRTEVYWTLQFLRIQV